MGKGKLLSKRKFANTHGEVREADNGAIFVVLRGGALFVIVAEDGYEHKWWGTRNRDIRNLTQNSNVHIAMNGAVRFTFDEWWAYYTELQQAI